MQAWCLELYLIWGLIFIKVVENLFLRGIPYIHFIDKNVTNYFFTILIGLLHIGNPTTYDSNFMKYKICEQHVKLTLTK